MLFVRVYNGLQEKMRQFNKIPRESQQPQKVRFQSGMSSQQKYNSIAESVLSKIQTTNSQQIKGCQMHPKPAKKCRKCQQLQLSEPVLHDEELELDQQFPQMIKINTNNLKSHFNQKLQNNIQNAQQYKTKVKPINNVRLLVGDLTSDQISIQVYVQGSTEIPTPFCCYFFRLAELRPTKQQLTIMLRANNVNVRCLALLYLRTYADPTIVYACLCNSFKDNKLLSIQTIGQYAMRLLDEDKLDHGGFRLPRLPIKIQRAITKKISEIKEGKEKQMEKQMQRQFQRERQRQVQMQRDRSRDKQKKRRSSSSSSSSNQNSQSLHNKKAPTAKLTLKQKIQMLQQKNQIERKRQCLLNSYKQKEVKNLQSQEQGYEQNDQVQNYRMG